jgi:hypothetical protein
VPIAGTLWPKPQYLEEKSSELSYLIKDKFEISNNLNKPCDIIEENIKLYRNILFPPKFMINTKLNHDQKILAELKIEIEDNICPLFPNLEMDETCN